MDVITYLRRLAYNRPRVFVAEAPGGTVARLRVEGLARANGWPLAESLPDTDVLVLCGCFGRSSARFVARLQAMLDPPASTLFVDDGDDAGGQFAVDVRVTQAGVESGLEAARQRLWQHPEPARTPLEEEREHADQGSSHRDHEERASGGDREDHSGHDHGAGDHERGRREAGDHESDDRGGHGDEAHDHDMRPGGLPMASRAEDRDGLSLDVLHVPLGPVLSAWPAGLTLQLTLQGDVVQDVQLDTGGFMTSGRMHSFWNLPWRRALAGEEVTVVEAERHRAAAHLDSLTRLLAVAGDEGGALASARLRDGALADQPADGLLQRVATLERRLARGRLLDRVTRGVGRIEPERAVEIGLSGPALRASRGGGERGGLNGGRSRPAIAIGEGDARSRWHQWFAETEHALQRAAAGGLATMSIEGQVEGPRGVLGQGRAPSRALLGAIGERLVGQELAVARLIVASFDPDVAELGEAGEP